MSKLPPKPFVPHGHQSPTLSPGKRFEMVPPYVHGRAAAPAPVSEELPSIDEFLDRTPPIDQFLQHVPAERELPYAQPRDESGGEWSWGGGPTPSPAGNQSPLADWQSFDWGSTASLGNAPPDAAAEAWASTDWSEPDSGKASRQSAAEALARALDQISRRIRAGELHVPGPEAVQDDAAIAATLAALLGIRR